MSNRYKIMTFINISYNFVIWHNFKFHEVQKCEGCRKLKVSWIKKPFYSPRNNFQEQPIESSYMN